VNKKFFLSILLLAFILRFYKLGEVPNSLNWDENSNAYNAYSILKTQKDEYGNRFPLFNKSFEDYKPPLYMYLTVPAVAIFGLTPFAARFASAFFGFLTIPAVYFLAKWLFRGKTGKELISLSVMFFLTISPWHMMFSRVGLEATIGLFMVVVAITIFLYGLKRNYLIPISAIFAGLSLYSYHAQRIFTPLIFIVIIFAFQKELTKVKKKFLISFVIISVSFALPLFLFVPKEAIFQRLNVSSSSFIKENVARSSQLVLQDHQSSLPFISQLHNRRLVLLGSYIQNYLLNFDPNFLFIRGDGNLRHHLKNFGVLNIFFLPLILLGMYFTFKDYPKVFKFLGIWLILGALPASPVTPAPHAIRSFAGVVPLITFAAVGITYFFQKKFILSEKSTAIYKISLITLCSFILFSISHFLFDYFRHYPAYSAFEWQYGYSDAAKYTQELSSKFQRIYVSENLKQAYIFWLFNLEYNPAKYQSSGSVNNFDKYHFSNFPQTSSDLFVDYASAFPQDFVLLKTIYYPNQEEAIKIGFRK